MVYYYSHNKRSIRNNNRNFNLHTSAHTLQFSYDFLAVCFTHGFIREFIVVFSVFYFSKHYKVFSCFCHRPLRSVSGLVNCSYYSLLLQHEYPENRVRDSVDRFKNLGACVKVYTIHDHIHTRILK